MGKCRFFKIPLLVFLLLPLFGGCEKELKGYQKVVGTATINGLNYQEATRWDWNFKGYPSDIELYRNYGLFNFLARLSPEQGANPKYTIYFYVTEEEGAVKLNHPYVINFYREMNTESLNWWDVIPYLSENASSVLAEGADGIVYAKASDRDEVIPMRGTFIVEEISGQRNICKGSYSLSSGSGDSDELVITGRFETIYTITDRTY